MKNENLNYYAGYRSFWIRNFPRSLTLLLIMFYFTISASAFSIEKADGKNSALSNQQQKTTIKGMVIGENSMTLPGANIVEKGTTNGTISDNQGRFELKVASTEAKLVFSFVGYSAKEVTVGNQRDFQITLEPIRETLDELVVVGYGSIKKKDLTGSVSIVKSDDLKSEGTNTAIKSLQGLIPGVTIESAGGSPGSGNRVIIRGTSTINGGSSPLYVVDGVPVGNIDNIPSGDIESINILKDASAAAIYGASGSAGVVLVTTKMGKSGENKVELKASYGFQNLSKRLDVLDAQQWATISNAARAADKKDPLSIATDPSVLGVGTDYQDAIYQTGITQDYNLSLAGGSDNLKYGISGGYFGQEGIVKLTNYERINLRIKSEYTKKRLKIGESIILSNEKYLRTPGAWGQGGNPISAALKMIPAFAIYDSTALGGYGGATGSVVDVANPVAVLNLTKNTDEYYNIFINVYAELEILKELKYKYNIGYNKSFSYNKYTSEAYKMGDLFSGVSNMSESRSQNNYFLQEHTLTYNKTFGKHSLNALAGFTFEKNNYRSLSGGGSDLASGLWVINAAQTMGTPSSSEYNRASVSYLGRIVYSYNDKYLLTASIRRDGSSRFGAAYRFGNFPSIALGWNVSNEPFFSIVKSTINNFKVRLSYGVLGNQSIGDYQYATSISPNFNYVKGNTLWSGSIQTDYASKDIKWEVGQTSNIGIDMGFLQNKLTFTADYFIKKNSDLLLQVPIPLSTGATSNPWVNYGQITNKGIELMLNYKNSINDFHYSVYGTFSSVKNIVDELGTGTQQIISGYPSHHGDGVLLTKAGYAVGSFYLVQTDGLFNSVEEINSYIYKDELGNPVLDKKGKQILIQPKAQPGDVKYVDANNDGQITANDRVVCGSSTPDFEYGLGVNLEWKGFDISLYMQGVHGNKIYNGLRMDMEDTRQNWNYSTSVLDYWTTENNSDVPRVTYSDKNDNNKESDRFLEDGSYLRFKTVQLGYNLPTGWTTKVGIDKARLYASFENLFILTKYSGFNPDLGRASSDWRDGLLERGVDYGHVAYPLPRTMTFGFQLTF